MPSAQKNQVTYHLVGGRSRKLTVVTATQSPKGEAVLGDVKAVLAEEHKVKPEHIVVTKIDPQVRGGVPYDVTLPAAPAVLGALPSEGEIGKLNKAQSVALAADLMAAFPDLQINTDLSVSKLHKELATAVAAVQVRQQKQAAADDAKTAADQKSP